MSNVDVLPLLKRLKQCSTQFHAQVRIDQRQELVSGLAAHVSEKAARLVGHVNDLCIPIDNHVRRGMMFKYALMKPSPGRGRSRTWRHSRPNAELSSRCDLRDDGRQGPHLLC